MAHPILPTPKSPPQHHPHNNQIHNPARARQPPTPPQPRTLPPPNPGSRNPNPNLTLQPLHRSRPALP
ncbi:hypothetical protein DID88_001496 [Monilinia fructigena]|uniref:Uncharacterized protein n=1 Tax=Monilinia fructigena TaxID=38457 RepID=A0A395IXA9_9HELO|nr:hypothetical protein DID88_001496 [Monilinia fructigena]